MSNLVRPVFRQGNTWLFDGRLEATATLPMIDGVLSTELVFKYQYTPEDVINCMRLWAYGKLTQAEYIEALNNLSNMPFQEKRIRHVPAFNLN